MRGVAGEAAKLLHSDSNPLDFETTENISVTDRHSLCTQLLIDGYVKAFADFFHLTHDEGSPLLVGEDSENSVTVDELIFVKDKLCEAEQAQRMRDVERVCASLKELAAYFSSRGDSKAHILFLEKALEAAVAGSDREVECVANEDLGLAYEKMENLPRSIAYHEEHLRIAKENKIPDSQERASHNLTRTYRAYADQREAANDTHSARALHEKCLEVANSLNDRQVEAEMHYRLGQNAADLGDPRTAIESYEKCFTISSELNDETLQGDVCAALAAAFRGLGDHYTAAQFLQAYFTLSKQTNHLEAQGKACMDLGVIYNAQGDYYNAVQYFEKNFEIARSVAKGPMVDNARVTLGIARGNAQMRAWAQIVNKDISALIQWKNRRIAFTDIEEAVAPHLSETGDDAPKSELARNALEMLKQNIVERA
eukprot:Rmarinus@m.4866